ncbi:DUF6580 family putative transport protein [Gallaecimonas sp. GXIMD1310]|uniref:DUF6580 family putative transport protein n=1 Tax=Gallaecimonas sp. GXIMD1310 TaxID=3131926 RepID=UPI003244EB03
MNPRLTTLVTLIGLCALYRLLPHPWNVSPVAAMALFAGAHFANRWLALLVPLAAMALSDLLLGLHATLPFVYGALMLTTLVGMRLGEKWSVTGLALASVGSSVLFFFVTNSAVWLLGNYYPPGWQGLNQALVAGLPFFQHSLLGDLLFSAALFGGFALLSRQFPALRPAQ